MKRILLFTLIIGLFAVQADAGMWAMDVPTAAGMTNWSVISGGTDTGALEYVGYNPGTLADKISGTLDSYGETMIYEVGFRGELDDYDESGDAIGKIYNSSPSLPNNLYGGFTLPLSNDNNQGWSFQAYAIAPTWSATSNWETLINDSQTTLIASIIGGGDKNFSEVTEIGFNIKWTFSPGGSTSDDFHASLVPVPGAVILGILGLGVVGIKLRKYA